MSNKSAGQLIDEALTHANHATGRLSLMCVKKKILRLHLAAAEKELDEALTLIRSALKTSPPES